jgi:hypothetical protein
MTPQEKRRVNAILDRQIAAISAISRKYGFPGAELLKTALLRDPTQADHVARARATIPARYEDGSPAAMVLAEVERERQRQTPGRMRGVPDQGLAKAGSSRAIDTVVNRILDVSLPQKDRGELINAIADTYFLGNTQKVLDWALAEREASDRRRNSFGKAGEPVIWADRFGNPVPSGAGAPLGTHIADRMHPMGGSGTGPRPQHPSSPDYLHIEDLKRGKRPFAPLWTGLG